MRGGFGKSIVFAALASSSLLAASAHAQEVAPLSREEISYELANTYRILADEQFLNNQRDAARGNYDKASVQADALKPVAGLVTEEQVQLLKAEIGYRKLLLDSNASFWGFEHQMRPISPVLAMTQFSETATQFQNEVVKIDDLATKIANNNRSALQDERSALQEQEQKAVAVLDGQVADTNLRNAGLRRAMIEDRVGAIAQRQQAIAAERESVLSQLDANQAGMNKLLLSAVQQAVGLPPNAVELVDAASRGDVDSALNLAVTAYASADPALTKSLGSFAEDARLAAQDYTALQGKVTNLVARANEGALLFRAIQSGDVSKVLEAGTTVFQNLPPEVQAKMLASVRENADLKAVVTLARKGTQLRGQVIEFVRSTAKISDAVRPVVAGLLDTASEQFDAHYALALSATIAAARTVDDQTRALVWISKAWSESVVDQALKDPVAIVAVAVLLGSPCKVLADCRKLLITQLQARGLTGAPVTVSSSGAVQIVNPATGQQVARFSLPELANTLIRRPVEQQRAVLRQDVNAVLKRLDEQQGLAMGRLLDLLPDTTFDRVVNDKLRALAAPDAGAAFQAITGPVDSPAAGELARGLASLSLGGDLARRTVLAPAGAAPVPDLTTPPSPAEQAALNALAAAGPYGVAASIALQALRGMSELSALADQADRLDKEDRSLSVELLHLAPLRLDVDRDESLAQLAQRSAQLRNAMAASRSQILQAALREDGQMQTELAAKIRSRLPLNYYLAELMREQYDRLDQSLALWTGQIGSAGPRIENLLRGDPRTARLALDPDIQLYDWFARNSEGQRRDLDQLSQHWNRLATVATQVCNTLGCDNNARDVGIVEVTEMVSLDALLGDIPPAGATRELSFTLLPRHLPDLGDLEGLRLVSVAGVVRNRQTDRTSSPLNIRIRHSGLGFLMVDGQGQTETFDSSDSFTPDFIDDASVLSKRRNDLQTRWSTSPKLGPLEGYALFGLYQISLPASFDPAKQSLELTFFYQHPRNAIPVDARLPTATVRCAGQADPRGIEMSDVRLLLRRDSNGLLSKLDGGSTCILAENRP
ncbi:hypothetical protein QH494_06845 [Sphingomonas sp. AR_OL41]|uniref:hypothetical protein n=1 Tax=Sphingomonas sp. AR_OL41 TaxID=3042729 RepID=UPI0024814F8C|nr:hypothetical protein [Sphingomonas sp. AR_OL41]MDH7971897.1 hypothetical protein [Sphingomonas sp. AR_OL41]